MPQEIDQAIVEQVYSSEWSERQSAMEKLKEQLKNKITISEEYSIELFSVLYPNLEDETTPVVKTCVECQLILLGKCKDVLSFVSYSEICNTLLKQMMPKSNHNTKALRQICKEMVMFIWNNAHPEGYISLLVWDIVGSEKELYSDGKLNMIQQKLQHLCVEVKTDALNGQI